MKKIATLRIHQRPDGKFEARNGNPMDSPLSVDPNLNMAIGSARREAKMLARDEDCPVVIEAMVDKHWTEIDRVEPPPNKRAIANDG